MKQYFAKSLLMNDEESTCIVNVKCNSHTIHKLTPYCLIPDCITLAESHSSCKFSSDWLLSYIKFVQPVFQIIKILRYIMNRLDTNAKRKRTINLFKNTQQTASKITNRMFNCSILFIWSKIFTYILIYCLVSEDERW